MTKKISTQILKIFGYFGNLKWSRWNIKSKSCQYDQKDMQEHKKRLIINMYSDSFGIRKLARQLGISHTTISRVLKEQGVKPARRGEVLEKSFNQILEYAHLNGVELNNMRLREIYRWFKENGFFGSWAKFRQLWLKYNSGDSTGLKI